MPVSIFAQERDPDRICYAVELQMLDILCGGVPGDPKIMEAHLGKRLGITDEDELRSLALRLLKERGIAVHEGMTPTDLAALSAELAADIKVTGFCRDERGLYLPRLNIKSMLKEAVNIRFAKQKWGVTNKGPLNWFVERIGVVEPRIYLGATERDGIHTITGRVSGPQGPRSIISQYEYLVAPTLRFHLDWHKDDDPVIAPHWRTIWQQAERGGLGAARNQQRSEFVVTRFEQV